MRISTREITADLEADHLFMMAGKICLIEQKIRDDHETLAGAQRAHSTKKRGQYDNFSRKYTVLREKYPGHEVIAVMWFIDDGLVKNRKYYTERAESESLRGVDIRIMYGGELFTRIFGRPDVWEELCSHLRRNKNERSNDILTIPDFDTSPEILRALHRLKAENVKLYSTVIISAGIYTAQGRIIPDRRKFTQGMTITRKLYDSRVSNLTSRKYPHDSQDVQASEYHCPYTYTPARNQV